jgi:hypothetical protein
MNHTKPASWVVVRKATGEVILETFSERTAQAINRAAYDVIPIDQYLRSLNHKR